MSQFKAWCFTLNNYTDDECSNIKHHIESESRYGIIGTESGEVGTPHLQGYVLFRKRYRFQTVKDRYLPRCHIEVARGTPGSNRAYCSKEGSQWEFGECPGDSFRSQGEGSSSRDVIAGEFVSAMDGGRHGMVEFSGSHPGTFLFSGHNLLRNYLSLQPAEDRPLIDVQWYYGAPGTGKSKKAHETLKEAFIKEPRTKWWNNYLLETTVIIDDFGPQGIDINHLLRWFDRYKCYVEYKGGMLPLKASTFIVTSNFHPSKIFSWGGEENLQLPALMRRITCVEF